MTTNRIVGRLSAVQKQMLECSVTGNDDLAQSLMALDPTALQARNSYGLSILQLAIINCHYHFAEYLVKEGVNVHNSDRNGWTALHDASLFNCKELINILVKYGCDILRKTRSGELPIDVASDEEMECFLCGKMAEAGHKDLALRYWNDFGLGHLCSNSQTWWLQENAPKRSSVEESTRRLDTLRTSPLTANDKSREGTFMKEKRHSSNAMNSKSELEQEYDHTREQRLVIKSKDHDEQNSINIEKKKRNVQVLSPLLELEVCSPFSDSVLLKATSPVPRRKIGFPMSSKGFPRSRSLEILITESSRALHLGDISRTNSDSDMYLTPEEIAKLGGHSSPQRANSVTDRAPIDLLKMRPRKPSIVDGTRKKSKELELELGGSRRSVSFQPEVLLQEVVTEGDTVLAKEIISSGNVDLNKISPVGLTALHQCALDGNLELAKTLVFNGADVNCIDSDGWTPLHGAAANGHTEMVRFLLLHGSNPTIATEDGDTPYKLTKRSSIRRILFRVSSGKTLDPSGGEDEVSDGEFSSEEEEDYSHAGSDSDEDDVCLSDSDPNLTANWNKISVLQESLVRSCSTSPCPERESVDSVFLENSPPSSALLLQDRELANSTSSYGSMTTEQEMFSRHGYVNDIETSSSKTSLTLCNEESPYLTDTDKELNMSDDQGISTMGDASSDSSHRRAICSDDEGMFHDLLDGDLQQHSLDFKFQEAVLIGDIDSVMKLHKIKNNIDVNRVNKTSGISALHHSVLEENYTLVQHLILDFQCNVNLVDADGWTPLHAASAVGNIRIAQFLLDNGAKASFLSKNCEFPVDVAEDEAMEELLKNAMLGPSIGKVFKGIFRQN